MKIAAEKTESPRGRPAGEVLAARAGSERDDNARLLMARQSPGFTNAREILADGLFRRATAIMLDYTQQGVGVRHGRRRVDPEGTARDRELGDPILESLKLLCGLNPRTARAARKAVSPPSTPRRNTPRRSSPRERRPASGC